MSKFSLQSLHTLITQCPNCSGDLKGSNYIDCPDCGIDLTEEKL